MTPTGRFRLRQSKFGHKLILQIEYDSYVMVAGELEPTKQWYDAKVSDLFVVSNLNDFGKLIHLK